MGFHVIVFSIYAIIFSNGSRYISDSHIYKMWRCIILFSQYGHRLVYNTDLQKHIRGTINFWHIFKTGIHIFGIVYWWPSFNKSNAVITRTNLSRYYIRHCNISGKSESDVRLKTDNLFGVSIVRILENFDRVITVPHCISKWFKHPCYWCRISLIMQVPNDDWFHASSVGLTVLR